jgi:hypothetical protein
VTGEPAANTTGSRLASRILGRQAGSPRRKDRRCADESLLKAGTGTGLDQSVTVQRRRLSAMPAPASSAFPNRDSAQAIDIDCREPT